MVFEDLSDARAHLDRIETKYTEALEFWHSDSALDLPMGKASDFEGRLDRLSIEGSALEIQIEHWESEAA